MELKPDKDLAVQQEEIILREAEIRDYEGLCQVYAELDEQHRAHHPELFIEPESCRRTKEYITGMINDEDKVLLVAVAKREIAGLAECYIQRSGDFPILRQREWVQLDGIGVKKEYQDRHIGSLLLEKAVDWAKKKGMDRIELKVYTFNEHADLFYEKKGFKDLSKSKYLNL